MYATTCETFVFYDDFEDVSCRTNVGDGGEHGVVYTCEDKMCLIKECVSGGRLGGVEGTRSPGGEIV